MFPETLARFIVVTGDRMSQKIARVASRLALALAPESALLCGNCPWSAAEITNLS
jgi:hypothetical protein